MSDIIHLLPDSVANQIAAGEVIQRPASVVKELVENAIDAEAGEIHVLITDAGKTCIQVIDDGKGMSETDARLSFERHATSKIREAADLFALRTMGFRGEALASIAAVAEVELKTRPVSEELGTRLLIAVERGACPGRNRFLEIRNPLLLSWSRTGNRILCKRFFLHRLVHPAGFFQTGIKPLPLHFGTRIIATTSIGRSGRRLEGIEIRVIVYLRRLYRTSLLECRNIRHVLGIKIDSRYSAKLT